MRPLFLLTQGSASTQDAQADQIKKNADAQAPQLTRQADAQAKQIASH